MTYDKHPDDGQIPVILYLDRDVFNELDVICKSIDRDLRELIEKKTNLDIKDLLMKMRGGERDVRERIA